MSDIISRRAYSWDRCNHQVVTPGCGCSARLLLELEFSDEGQLAYAQGFTHPIRDITLPPDLLAKFPPTEEYQSVKFPTDFSLLTSAAEAIATGWDQIAQ